MGLSDEISGLFGHPPISLSLPLSADEFSQKECLPFFEGLLPEGDVKRRISDYLHISETSTLKLLQELGGECAGLVSILPESEENKTKNVYDFSSLNYEPLTEKKLVSFFSTSTQIRMGRVPFSRRQR